MTDIFDFQEPSEGVFKLCKYDRRSHFVAATAGPPPLCSPEVAIYPEFTKHEARDPTQSP